MSLKTVLGIGSMRCSSTFGLLSLKIHRQKIPGKWLETVQSNLISKLEKIRDQLGSSVYQIKLFKGDTKNNSKS